MKKTGYSSSIMCCRSLSCWGSWRSHPSASFAAGYPDHTIQLIIPNVPGALMDINGRLVAEELGNILGQKIIVMNKPGAGTVLGTEAALRSKKDGYTLLYASAAAFVSAPASNPGGYQVRSGQGR